MFPMLSAEAVVHAGNTTNITHAINHTMHTVHAAHDTSQLLIVFAPMAILLIGALVNHFFTGLPIPYTVMLLGVGFLLGSIVRRTDVFGSDMNTSVQIMSQIDPHTFLYIFLPPLIFESAFSLE
jgi:hypothetical protein